MPLPDDRGQTQTDPAEVNEQLRRELARRWSRVKELAEELKGVQDRIRSARSYREEQFRKRAALSKAVVLLRHRLSIAAGPWPSRALASISGAVSRLFRLHPVSPASTSSSAVSRHRNIYFHLDAVPPDLTGESAVLMSGWCFSPLTFAPVPLRVKSSSLRRTEFFHGTRALDRPDIAAGFGNTPNSRECGFSFSLPLRDGRNSFVLEARLGREWFVLYEQTVLRVGRSVDPPEDRSAEQCSEQGAEMEVGRCPRGAAHSDPESIEEIVVAQTPWPKDRPLVSVVIPCFNYGDYVEQAIDSVLGQTFQDLEIIVVEGGSTDGSTVEKVLALRKPKTRVFVRKGRHLAGDNRNYGIKEARGKYVCCLDADDEIRPTYLEKALFLLETYNYDFVYPSAEFMGAAQGYWVVSDVDFETCLNTNGVSTVAVFKKSAWDAVGGYRDWGVGEDHVPEDWEFWVRILGNGFRGKSLHEPLMLYRKHGGGLTVGCKRTAEESLEVIKRANSRLLSEKNLRAIRRAARTCFVVDRPHINILKDHVEKKDRVLFALQSITLLNHSMVRNLMLEYKERDYEIHIVAEGPREWYRMPAAGDCRQLSENVYVLSGFLDSKDKWDDFVNYILLKNMERVYIAGPRYGIGKYIPCSSQWESIHL